MTLQAPRATILALFIAAFQSPSLGAEDAQQPAGGSPRLIGDVGIGVDLLEKAGQSKAHHTIFPYANFDYGRAFARIDTFGLKLLPLGYGDLELAARVMDDGYVSASPRPNTPRRRNNSLPLGLGTLQTTPYGAIFFNYFRDVASSKGELVDIMYAAELDFDRLALYPQAGLQQQSAAYVRYYYGTSPSGAPGATGAPYQPRSAASPYAGLFLEYRLRGSWYANVNLRRTWLDPAISSSPAVMHRRLDSAMFAFSYRYN